MKAVILASTNKAPGTPGRNAEKPVKEPIKGFSNL